jgi:hypothetical protein
LRAILQVAGHPTSCGPSYKLRANRTGCSVTLKPDEVYIQGQGKFILKPNNGNPVNPFGSVRHAEYIVPRPTLRIVIGKYWPDSRSVKR